jgi:arsenate reductase
VTETGRIRLLFVCVENSGRSQMAEGFARALAGDRVVAWSAGSRPSGQVSGKAMRLMEEKGVSLEGHRSKGLDDLPPIPWDWIVTMGCGDACPIFPGKRYEDWELDDPAGQPVETVRRIRDDIQARVRTLLRELTSEG